MPDFSLYHGLGIALALGLLIGVERGWSARGEPAGGRVAGLRTFGLLGLLGGLAGFLMKSGNSANTFVLAAIFVATGSATLVFGYVRDMRQDGNVSATTTIAGLITLALGVLAVTGYPIVASVTAGIMLILLAMRAELHGWVGSLSAIEVKAVARFALIAIVVWPLLPNTDMGPLDAWNPRMLWTVVVLISGLSFAGYIATKRLGDVRGVLATACAGALISSTAVTAALARRLAMGDSRPPLVAGIAAAGAVMMLRTLALTALLAGFALETLAFVALPAAGVAALIAAWSLRNAGDRSGAQTDLAAANPFDLLPALGFGVLLAAAALFARWASIEYGDSGLAIVLAITGTFDVDAAIVTMGGLPPGTMEPRLAGLILAVPILLNTAFKAAITIGIAGWTKGRAAAAALAASLTAGVAVFFVLIRILPLA